MILEEGVFQPHFTAGGTILFNKQQVAAIQISGNDLQLTFLSFSLII
ncbi:MAG: hypothetical protein HFG49_06450 [Lachnospiraceae bacterium]|nr:hypothetical protein [Lachnospiraceae bacterium]